MTSNRETTMQNGERKALISKGTKCLEKNEHNELQIQKGKSWINYQYLCVLYLMGFSLSTHWDRKNK